MNTLTDKHPRFKDFCRRLNASFVKLPRRRAGDFRTTFEVLNILRFDVPGSIEWLKACGATCDRDVLTIEPVFRVNYGRINIGGKRDAE